jgi:hypothetical protein
MDDGGTTMTTLLCQHPAPGDHVIAPRWTRSDKDGMGTAYSASSRVWFTVSKGILNEVYYPTIDRPQIRDLQYLITDGGETRIEATGGGKTRPQFQTFRSLSTPCSRPF